MPSTADIDIELLGANPERSLGPRLVRDLEHADTASIAVAFAKQSAIKAVDLVSWCDGAHKLRLVAGTDFALTELALLRRLEARPGTQCHIFHKAAANRVFHPKLYVFDTSKRRIAYVGSANLTAGGLQTNFESVVRMEGPKDHPVLVEPASMFEEFFDSEFASPITPAFEVHYRSLQKAQRDAEASHYQLREVKRLDAEDRLTLADHRGHVAHKRWLLVTTPENYDICMRTGTWGRQRESEIRAYHRGDVFFFHVARGHGVAAMGMFTGLPYRDESPLWPGTERGSFPWRIRFVSLGELRTGISTREALEPLRQGAPKGWYAGYTQSSHSLERSDFDAIAAAFNVKIRADLESSLS